MKRQLHIAWLVLKTVFTHPLSDSVIYEEDGKLKVEHVNSKS